MPIDLVFIKKYPSDVIFSEGYVRMGMLVVYHTIDDIELFQDMMRDIVF